MSQPMVSVVVTTYEHEAFVEQALSSVVAQQASFSFEVVVGVDASEDATARVVQRFEREYPRIVRSFYHPQRVGLIENFRSAHAAVRGRFVALLEGDDYWTDHDKLAIQVEQLLRKEDAAVSGHFVEQITPSGRRLGSIPDRSTRAAPSRAEWISRHCDFHTSSLVYRNYFLDGLPPTVLDERNGVVDLPLKLALVSRGDVEFVPRCMSVFRRLPGSASAAFGEREFGEIVVRSLAAARGGMAPELRSALECALIEALVAGALSPALSAASRLGYASRALAIRPGESARLITRGVYSKLPERLKRAYRRVREPWRRVARERRG